MTDEEGRASTSTTEFIEKKIKQGTAYYRWDNLIYLNLQFQIDGNQSFIFLKCRGTSC